MVMLTSEACATRMKLHREWVCAIELGTQQVVTKHQHLSWSACHFLMRTFQLLPDFLTFSNVPGESLYPGFPALVVPWTQKRAVLQMPSMAFERHGKACSVAWLSQFFCCVTLGNCLKMTVSHSIYVLLPIVKRDKVILTPCGGALNSPNTYNTYF